MKKSNGGPVCCAREPYAPRMLSQSLVAWNSIRELRASREGGMNTFLCSEGGFGVALAERCSMGEVRRGASVSMTPGEIPPHAWLFGEDASRVLISFPPNVRARVEAEAGRLGVPLEPVGEVGGDALEIAVGEARLEFPVTALASAWEGSTGVLA